MAKPNYAFAKRQRDLAKKQKKEEKKLRKTGSPTEGAGDSAAEQADQSPDPVAGQDIAPEGGDTAASGTTPGPAQGGNQAAG